MAGNSCISAPRHMQAKVHGPSISISQDSALVIEGANIEVKSLELDGALVLQTSRKARLVVDGLKLHNRGWKWQALKAEKPMSEEQYIRYSALSLFFLSSIGKDVFGKASFITQSEVCAMSLQDAPHLHL